MCAAPRVGIGEIVNTEIMITKTIATEIECATKEAMTKKEIADKICGDDIVLRLAILAQGIIGNSTKLSTCYYCISIYFNNAYNCNLFSEV